MSATEIPTPRLKNRYEDEIRDQLMERFELKSIMAVPRLSKITLNMGVGEAKVNSKALDDAVEELAIISGQHPVITRATKSIAGFKLREGMPIGCKVTLRGDRMYEFLDRLMTIALPRIRDFRGNQSRLVRRPWQLRHGRSRAGDLPRDQLRRRQRGAGPQHHDYDHGSRRRAGARAPARAGNALLRLSKRNGTDGKGSTQSQAGEAREVLDPRVSPLRAVRSFACLLPQVRCLPDLSARACSPGRDSWNDEEQLVRSGHDY